MALVDDNPLQVSRNNILATFETWGPRYAVTFEMYVHTWLNGWHNIIQFAAEGAGQGVAGHRDPSFHNWGNELSIGATINGAAELFWIDGVESGKWISVLIAQSFHRVNIKV